MRSTSAASGSDWARTGISARRVIRGWRLAAGGYTGSMPSAFESALLNLRLFELRRDPVLREARMWFLRDFNPDTIEELVALIGGEHNASFRMVLGYWDMAASLVTSGAIDCGGFLREAQGVFGTFREIIA